MFQLSIVQRFTSSSRGWKLTDSITGTSCRDFCRASLLSRSITHSKMTAHRRTELERQLKSWVTKRRTSFRLPAGNPTARIWIRWIIKFGVLCRRVFTERKFVILRTCDNVSCKRWTNLIRIQGIIDASVKQWRTRLHACVAANGGQFEHKLWVEYN